MTVRTFHHDDEEFARLQSINAELLAALEAIKALSPGGPHISAEAGFKATFLVLCQARDIASAAIKKAESK